MSQLKMSRSLKLGAGLVIALVGLGLAGCKTQNQMIREEGISLYEQGQYDASLVKMHQLLEQDQFNAEANAFAAANYANLGKYQQSEYHYKLAWKADPSRADVKDGLLEVFLRQGKREQALDFLERDASLTAQVADSRVSDPKNLLGVDPTATRKIEARMFANKNEDRLRVARAYERIGDYDNAKIYYEALLADFPRHIPLKVRAAEFYEKIGDKVRLEQLAREAFAGDPGYPGLSSLMIRNHIAIYDSVK